MNKISKRRNFLKTMAIVPCAIAVSSPLSANTFTNDDHTYSNKLLEFVKYANVSEVLEVQSFEITGKDLPWSKKLMQIKKGQEVTFLLNGKWWLSKKHNMWTEPGIPFFARVGKGNLYNTGKNTGTMIAQQSGSLELARAIAEFPNEKGELSTPHEIYTKNEGLIEGIAIVWKNKAIDGLRKLSAHGDFEGAIHSEIQRIQHVPSLPKGWKNIHHFGESGIFSDIEDNKISCVTHKNVGILQKDVSVSLTKDLKFDWKWMVKQLPSVIPENHAGTHDYLSIAVKFDDGQDITYMWSADMHPETSFRCPLPNWTKIETHVVQRSGQKELGKWLSESRDITQDYEKLIGGNAKKVTQIWMIANTVFMRGTGICEYSNIILRDSKSKTVIL